MPKVALKEHVVLRNNDDANVCTALPQRYIITLSQQYHVIILHYHIIITLSHYHIITRQYHITLPHYHIIIWSGYHINTLSHYYITTLPHITTLFLTYDYSITLSCYHRHIIITLPHDHTYHMITLSYYSGVLHNQRPRRQRLYCRQVMALTEPLPNSAVSSGTRADFSSNPKMLRVEPCLSDNSVWAKKKWNSLLTPSPCTRSATLLYEKLKKNNEDTAVISWENGWICAKPSSRLCSYPEQDRMVYRVSLRQVRAQAASRFASRAGLACVQQQ